MGEASLSRPPQSGAGVGCLRRTPGGSTACGRPWPSHSGCGLSSSLPPERGRERDRAGGPVPGNLPAESLPRGGGGEVGRKGEKVEVGEKRGMRQEGRSAGTQRVSLGSTGAKEPGALSLSAARTEADPGPPAISEGVAFGYGCSHLVQSEDLSPSPLYGAGKPFRATRD